MVVKFSKTYIKQYRKLAPRLQKQTNQRIQLFLTEPSSPQLHDHALTGKYKGYRSINITGDVRALYRQQGSTLVIFAFVGTHSQLYD